MRIAVLLFLIAFASSLPKKTETTTSSPSSTGALSEAQFKALHELLPVNPRTLHSWTS